VKRLGSHGDNWCITWAADDSQITSMDDGDWLRSGHGFHNHLYQILGGPNHFRRQDIPNYPDLSGQAGSWFGYGIVSVDGVLYSVVSKTPQTSWSGPFRGIKLLKSPDNGATWFRVDRHGRERRLANVTQSTRPGKPRMLWRGRSVPERLTWHCWTWLGPNGRPGARASGRCHRGDRFAGGRGCDGRGCQSRGDDRERPALRVDSR